MYKGIPIRAVSRALTVLQAINRLPLPTINEVTQETGLPYPTVFRLMMTLLTEGVIECEPGRKRYKPTELAKTLSAGFQENDFLVNIARPHLEALTMRLHWPITLTVRVGSRMMVKYSTDNLTTQTLSKFYPGYTLPLFDCASGRAHFAFCSDLERQSIIEAAKEFSSEDDNFSPLFLNDPTLVKRIRDDGYATHARSPHTQTPGKTSALSVPIMVDGDCIATLTLVVFANVIPIDKVISTYLQDMLDISATISREYVQA